MSFFHDAGASMTTHEVAYLGPIGTYSHLVAEKYGGRGGKPVPFPTITDVCAFVAGHPGRHGIVPIENSSGGAIYETVDILLANRPRVRIEAELSLNVRLALLGRAGEPARVLYSHFAPLEHCGAWIKRHLPRIEKRVVASTAVAGQRAAGEHGALALGNRKLARLYGLQVLHYPVQAELPNVTVFYAIGGGSRHRPHATKTTLAAKLPNIPGSLCTFLETFRDRNVNLTRLISRPIRGCPREYVFLVDIEGGVTQPAVRQAMAAGRRTCVELRLVGSYPCHTPYRS
jgi:chorismate mutase / prephenate dehydratase